MEEEGKELILLIVNCFINTNLRSASPALNWVKYPKGFKMWYLISVTMLCNKYEKHIFMRLHCGLSHGK